MKYAILSLTGLAAIALSSCNTTIGLGRDMRILGEGMERKATETYQGDSSIGNTDTYNPQPDTGGAPIY